MTFWCLKSNLPLYSSVPNELSLDSAHVCFAEGKGEKEIHRGQEHKEETPRKRCLASRAGCFGDMSAKRGAGGLRTLMTELVPARVRGTRTSG